MSWVIVPVLMVIGLVLSALFSGAETGLYCVSRLRLQLSAQQRDPGALRLSGVLEDRQAALGMTLVGTNLSNYVTTIAMAFLFADLLGFSDTDTEVYTVVILTPIVFVFGEVVPKSLFQRYADLLLIRCSWLLASVHWLLRITGVLWCHKHLTSFVTNLTGTDLAQRGTGDPKRRMATLLQEALAGQTLGDDRSYLIDQVIQLSETPLHAVMVPRNGVTTVAGRANRRDLMRIARRTTYSRLPVYDADPRHMIGLIKVDDLLRSQAWETVGDRLRPVTSISPHVTVATAISRMQGSGRDMAIVTDRGGRMLGVVTLKDLLDTLLGEFAAGV